VEVPEGFQLEAAGPDWILGTSVEDFDVEVVQLFPLVK
jgi:hypothetical protein